MYKKKFFSWKVIPGINNDENSVETSDLNARQYVRNESSLKKLIQKGYEDWKAFKELFGILFIYY